MSVAADVKRMAAEIEAHLGGIAILINNAGIAHPRKLEEIAEAEWDEVLTVNLKSVFLVTQAVIGGMRQRRWGRIINLSSVAAQTGGAVGAHYAASKAGIIGLTHSCASSFVRDGITVNAIAPALIGTDMVTSNPNANPNLIPMGHFGSTDDIASVAVMLAMNAEQASSSFATWLIRPHQPSIAGLQQIGSRTHIPHPRIQAISALSRNKYEVFHCK